MKEKWIENELLTSKPSVMGYLGKTFIKTPRSIFGQMQSEDVIERQMAHLHLLLFGVCYHTDGYCMLKKQKVVCRRGEFVGKQATLAKWMNISACKLSRLLAMMENLHLISVQRIRGGSRISVNGYDEFTHVPAESETRENKKTTTPQPNAAYQMAEAEKKMGGRSMQNATNHFN